MRSVHGLGALEDQLLTVREAQHGSGDADDRSKIFEEHTFLKRMMTLHRFLTADAQAPSAECTFAVGNSNVLFLP
jgi:hypothetical protein